MDEWKAVSTGIGTKLGTHTRTRTHTHTHARTRVDVLICRYVDIYTHRKRYMDSWIDMQ